MSSKEEPKSGKVVGFLGVGLDHSDGEQRFTRSEYFFLAGGSQETHEKMQDTAIRFTEELKRRKKPLEEMPVDEVVDIFFEAREP